MTEKPKFGDADRSFNDQVAEAREVMAQGDGAVAEWLAEDSETRTELQRIAREDPEAAEAALHHLEDEELLADPQLQESIRQMEAGEGTDITPTK